MNQVQEFYNQIGFPGPYTYSDLQSYWTPIKENRFLAMIESYVNGATTVLDAGCGTGLISNLFALRNPEKQIDAIDFSDSINYADFFAKTNNISNVNYTRADLITHEFTKKYDLVLCQGVLHHIPEYRSVIDKLTSTVLPNGKMLLGVYHPAGKIIKKFIKINYNSEVLFLDQEKNPHEISFTPRQVADLLPEWKIIDKGPAIMGNVAIPAFLNFKSGGLVIYVLTRK